MNDCIYMVLDTAGENTIIRFAGTSEDLARKAFAEHQPTGSETIRLVRRGNNVAMHERQFVADVQTTLDTKRRV